MSQLTLIIMGFFSQRTMNLIMGEELVGMNGVISNIIGILSVSEMGISSAIVFRLYHALANRDEEKTTSLMSLYRRAYYIFAAAITIMGLCLMPAAPLFMRGNKFSPSYIRLIYVLWLARTALSYLLSCKRSILIADQKEYVVSIGTLFVNIFNYGTVIVVLKLWQNYQLALFINILAETALNLWIIRYVDKKYPYLKGRPKAAAGRGMTHTIIGDVKNIFIARLSSKLLVSTDNLIISGFISIGVVGRYSNYSLISQSVSNVMISLSNSIQPTVGNLFVEEDQEKNYLALRDITFVFFMLGSFCAASLMSLMTYFVTDFWLSPAYAIGADVVACCAANCYFFIMTLPTTMMMTVGGMFDKERNVSILYAAANLAVSLLLVKPFGVKGVLLGTLASYLVQLFVRIRVFFRGYLHKSSARYVADMVQYAVLAAIESCATFFAVRAAYGGGGLARFFLAMILCVVIPNGTNLIIFAKSGRLKSIVGMIKQIRPQRADK